MFVCDRSAYAASDWLYNRVLRVYYVKRKMVMEMKVLTLMSFCKLKTDP